MKPRDAKTFDDVCNLKEDNKNLKHFWMLIDGSNITIAKQDWGEDASEIITIPRRAFIALVDWYNKDQKIEGGER